MTLRLRLVLVLVGLVAAGLLVAGSVTYTSLRSFLLQRVDQQLREAAVPMARALEVALGPGHTDGGRPQGSPPSVLPPGTYGELRDAAGNVIDQVHFTYGDSTVAVPDLPAQLPATDGTSDGMSTASAAVFTVGALGASAPQYRVISIKAPPSDTLVVAVPLTEVTQTLNRLLLVEVPLTGLVLLGLAVLAWWIVRRGLRPLEHMGATAAAIADGDLSARVETVDPRTEVGRLGVALNIMLHQIEKAFAERRASEDRLRRFLADASHELRTPLTSIRGYAELFRRGANHRPDDLAASMRRIEQEAARMGVLVDDLLLLARLDQARALRMEQVDLSRIVEDAAQDARAADPTRTIEVKCPGPVLLSGDEDRLRQVASNLLSNALSHTPPGTAVQVAVAVEEEEAVLSVADHGPGLQPQDVARVFEPFFRVDESRGRANGGAGLGLSIVAAVAAAHGGSAEAESSPGHGATFSVRLPLHGGPPAEEPSTAVEACVEAGAEGGAAEPLLP